jgi:hypothetical protein
LVGKQREKWQEKHKENREELKAKAASEMQGKLGVHNLSEQLENQLAEFEFHFQEFKIVNEKNAMPVAAQKVLEMMMQEIADQDFGIFRRVRTRIPATKSREDLAVVIESAAILAGADEIPDIYAKSKPQQIAAWPWKPVSLRPMVAATLIATHDLPRHTFTKMINAEPKILRFIADASMLRDAGAHADTSNDDEIKHYAQMHQEIYQIISVFINATTK